MTERHPIVSVIIPTYNHGHLIGRALESVLSQTFQNFEIIVVDNHSTDNTDLVLASYACSRLTVLKVHNLGSIAYSRNHGISSARGDWIAFLDSDDWWMPHKLQECSRHFHNSDLIYHRLTLSGSFSRLSFPYCSGTWPLKSPILTHLLKSGNPIPTSSVVVRRTMFELIDGFNEKPEFIAAEDYDAWIRLAKITERFSYISDYLGFYHYSPHSASRKDMSLPMRAVYSSHADVIFIADYMSVDANAAYSAASFAFKNNCFTVALNELPRSLLHGRFELKLRSFFLLLFIICKYLRSLFVPFTK